MTGKINQTLLQSLFLNPSPQNANLFNATMSQMFPDRELFEHFLESPRTDDQIEHARQILLRFASESSLSPTNRLILNLLDFESHLSGLNGQSFVGRDHFVHLVHLYLLGLYIFWYHKTFHKSLLTLFKSKRLELFLGADENDKITDINLFLTAWKNFILLHDVAYPIEPIMEGTSLLQYTKPLVNIGKNLKKECALRCLSRLISFQILLNKYPKLTFGESYKKFLDLTCLKIPPSKQNLFTIPIDLSRWMGARKMPVHGSCTVVSFLQTVFASNNLLVVIEREDDGRPVWIMQHEGNKELFTDEDLKNIKTISYFISSVKRGFYESTLSDEFVVAIYANNFEKLFLENVLVCTGDKGKDEDVDNGFENIKELAIKYSDKNSSPFAPSTQSEDFRQLSFNIYYSMLGDMDYLVEDAVDPLSKFKLHGNTHDKLLKNLDKNILREIQPFLMKTIKERAKYLNKIEQGPTQSFLDVYIKNLFQPLRSNKLSIEFYDKIRRQFDGAHSLYSLLRKTFDKVIANINRTGIFDDVEPPVKTTDDCKQFYLNQLAPNYSNKLFTSLLTRLQTSSSLTLDSLKTYRPDYIENGKTYCDHGIGAALLGCKTGSAILDLRKKNDALPFKVAFGHDERHTRFEDFLFHESCYAMLLHNIYPDFFASSVDQSFRTKQQESPFAFFAIFCDSLQPWDRKRLGNLAYAERTFNSRSEDFDIHINAERIYVSEVSFGLRIDDRYLVLRKYLDSYLENASKFIRLNLGEK